MKKASFGVKTLKIFDFDGTLFRSPESESPNWWDNPESLAPPLVPESPGSSWYLKPAVQELKSALGKADEYAVVCTGRKEYFRPRLKELLANAGIHCELFLNPGQVTSSYKVGVLRYLARMFPGLQEVQVWEDNKENLRALERAAHKLGFRFVGHFKKHQALKVAGKLPNYVGLFLTPQSRKVLLKEYPPIHENIFADHVTLVYEPTAENVANFELGDLAKFRVVSEHVDDKARALRVELPLHLAAFAKPGAHVTVSTAAGVPPSYSNTVIRKPGSRAKGQYSGIVDIPKRDHKVMKNRFPLASKQAAQVAFTPEYVDKLRKEFLLMMKNSKIVKTPEQAIKWREGAQRWSEQFWDLIDKRIPDVLRAVPRFTPSVTRNEVQQWEQKIRADTWDFYLDVRPPMSRPTREVPAGVLFERFKQDLPKWDAKVRRKARVAWKTLKHFIAWYRHTVQETPHVEIPKDENATLEGLKVVVRGFNGSSFHEEYLERFKEGLKLYKQRAQAVLPLLLKMQLPLVLDFAQGLGKGGSYHGTWIMVNPFADAKNPGRMVQILAHEMGHYLYQRYLSNEDTKFWYMAVTGNYGELDLRDVLRKYGTEGSFFENKRIRQEDPILYLQIQGLFEAGVSPYKEVFERRGILSLKDIQEYLDEGGQAKWRVHGKPITGYANKNPEEAFCEAIGMLVGYGPRTVLPEVRSWLQTILPNLRIARRVASRWIQLRTSPSGASGDR